MSRRSRPFSTERRAIVAATAAAVAAAVRSAVAAPAPVDRAAAEARLRAVLADGAYQQKLPDAPTPPDLPAWLEALLRLLAEFAGPLVVIGAAIVLVLVVYGLVHTFRRRRAGAAADLPPAAPAAADALVDLADAERLAAAGRHAEAVHVLLLAAIDRAGRLAARRPSRAATARELARTLALEPPRRDAFAGLVRLVETSLFGGRALGPEDWRAGRALFDAFAGAR